MSARLLLRRIAAWMALFAALCTSPALAQPMDARAANLVTLINGKSDVAQALAPSFLAAVPVERVNALFAQLRRMHGPALSQQVAEKDSFDTTVSIAFRDGVTARFRMALAREAPHRIIGLLLTATEVPGDDFAKLRADFEALPGAKSLLVTRIGGDEVLAIDADRTMPIASAFKLYILAELVRRVETGEAKWSDVVPLNDQSLPSGILQDWPRGTPMTLQSLATLMISISDNSAADTLLFHLGRDAVGAMLARTGHHDPDSALPILATREAFVLKSREKAALARRYADADRAGRAAILARDDNALRRGQVDPADIVTTPRLTDSAEWFASARDLSHLLQWLDAHADGPARALWAVNPGIGRDHAARWAWVGYKGGSETGVLSATLLLRAKDGSRAIVTAAWQDDKALDERRFFSLIERVSDLLAKDAAKP